MVPPEDPQLLPDGVFSFGQVVPGNYQIRARGQTDPAGAALFAVYSLQVLGNDVENIQMALRPGAMLSGWLTVESKRGTKPPAPAPRPRARAVHRRQRLRRRADGQRPARRDVRAARPHGGRSTSSWSTACLRLGAEERAHRGTDITDRQFYVTRAGEVRDVRVTITGRHGPGHRRRAERAQPARRQHRRADLSRATRCSGCAPTGGCASPTPIARDGSPCRGCRPASTWRSRRRPSTKATSDAAIG